MTCSAGILLVAGIAGMLESPPAETCSATDVTPDIPALPDEPQLPAPVADLRTKLYGAATACDFDSLGQLARDNAKSCSFTCGVEKDAQSFWRKHDERDRILDRLARILTTPVIDKREDERAFAWPSVYADVPAALDWDTPIASGTYTAGEIATSRQVGTYYGYRLGITPKGDWSYFVAGD